MSLSPLHVRLSEAVGYPVERHPYDIGYAKRVAGWARPQAAEQARGWDQADRELSAEAAAAGRP